MHHHLNEERQRFAASQGIPDRQRSRRAGRPGRLHGRGDVLDADAILGLQRSVGNGAVPLAGGGAIPGARRDQVRRAAARARTYVQTWRRAWATTSPTCGCTTTAAAASATAVNAHAYTVGSNVVFQRDNYDPVAGGQDHAGPRADPRRAAAQRTGGRHRRARRDQGQRPWRPVRAGGRCQRRAGDAGPAARPDRGGFGRGTSRAAARGRGGGPVQGMFVQRQEEEEEPVQGLFVQRGR